MATFGIQVGIPNDMCEIIVQDAMNTIHGNLHIFNKVLSITQGSAGYASMRRVLVPELTEGFTQMVTMGCRKDDGTIDKMLALVSFLVHLNKLLSENDTTADFKVVALLHHSDWIVNEFGLPAIPTAAQTLQDDPYCAQWRTMSLDIIKQVLSNERGITIAELDAMTIVVAGIGDNNANREPPSARARARAKIAAMRQSRSAQR